MPNQYPYFDAGTWEVYNNAIEYSSSSGSLKLSQVQRATDLFYSGAASGKCTLLYVGNPPGTSSRAYVMAKIRTSSGGDNIRPLTLQPNAYYTIRCRVRTPSTNPIGSADMLIAIGPGPRGIASGESVDTCTVADCTDAWVEISFTFRNYPSTSPSYFNIINLSLFPEDQAGYPWLTGAGDAYLNGVLYFDAVSLEPVAECDLDFDSPAYTKTDETEEGADDGTVTINAIGDYTKQYSKDGVNWQASNLFTGLPPGEYTFQVRDTQGCVIDVDVVITAAGAVDPPPPVEAGVLEINAEPLNKGNYVTWFSANGDTAFTSMSFTNCDWDLPNAYRLNKFYKRHYPVVVNAERFSFYMNFTADYNNPSFSSLRLALIKGTGVVQNNIATLQRVFQPDGVKYFIYANVTLAEVPLGYYRLAIVDVNDENRILFVSNEIQVMSSTEAPKYTARFQYRNSSDIFRFLYGSIDTFYNEIRLRVNILDEATDGEISQYRAVSTGVLRNVNYELDKFYTLETYYFDDLAHRATEILQVHDGIIINGRSFLVKALYKVDRGNPARYLHKGKLELYEQAFSTANRYGEQNADALEDTDAYLLGDDGGRIKL